MAKTWNKYFDETDVKDWGTLPFHESWAHTYKDDYEKLSYDKATDAFLKSLRTITNKSSDIEKVRKAVFLMFNQVSIYLIFMCAVAKSLENFLCL
jgi:hypothetical protein